MAVGKIGPFELHKDSWDLYVDRLEQYFVANDVKEAIKVATLITVIGNDTYELMVSLCMPTKPATKSFADLVKIMKDHLQPRPSLLAERFKFRQRTQKSDESIAEYVAELKRLTKDCNFTGDSLKENLRDQFVWGLRSDSIRQRLFTEDDIKFDKALTLAVAMESAEADAALVESRVATKEDSTSGFTPTLHQLSFTTGRAKYKARPAAASGGERRAARDKARAAGPSGTSGAGSGGGWSSRQPLTAIDRVKGLCKACGGQHSTDNCKFNVYVCRICNNEGHLKRVCPRLRGGAPVHNVAEEPLSDTSESFTDSEEVNNFSIDSEQLKKFGPYTIALCVNDKCLNMEIDTGSTISCISYACFEQLFSDCKLIDTDLTLRYYTGEQVVPMGKFMPLVKYKTNNKHLDLYVVRSGKTNLLGRQWLQELGINIEGAAAHCNNIKSPSFNLDHFSSSYHEVFNEGLGRFTGGTVGFRLREGATPVFLRARPLAYALREPVERELDRLVREGVLTPVNTSDWATPIVPVMKKDGTIRICGDFKLTLNKSLEVDHFPLPRVEDLLTKLHQGEKFSKIDLSQAYAQFELDESRQYTVINTHKGLFRYNRLIYGLASSPGIFQRKLEQLFADMQWVGVFLDDIIITGPDDSTHLDTLTEVFERLKKYGLKVKKNKCTFFSESVTYLGFMISKKGVHTCSDKIEAIKKVGEPHNVSELRSFLGLVMYYSKFVPNVSTVLAPLYKLLQKNSTFEWNEDCQKAFKKIKSLLVSSEVLAHYSPDLPLILTTDASSVGVGAVISHVTPQGERPVAYASRTLNAAEKAYSQIEREGLSIIFGIKKFHQYLYGRKFTLRTDHKPLVSIFGDKSGIPVMAASRMQRWAVLLAGYHYSIEYVRSDRNAADALSRLPAGAASAGEARGTRSRRTEMTYLNFIQNFLPITRKTVQNEISKDDDLKKVMLYIQSGWPTVCTDEGLKPYFLRRNELYLEAGCIVWGYRLVIPTTLRDSLLKEVHIGHMGIVKMKSVARSTMWWPRIDAAIEKICKECRTCTAEGVAPPRAAPQPWPYVSEPWTRLHVDFMGPLHGNTFLILIDASSKWLEIFKMTRTTAKAVIGVLRETFARFGLPREVVSDNGPPFSSKEYSEFMSNNGIKVTFASPYHPSSNGAAEGAVKLCKRAVKKALKDGCDVDAALQAYLLAYRNVEHGTTGTAPAMLLQRRCLRSRLDLLKINRQVVDRVTERQEKQVEYAGGRTRDLNVGQSVLARNYGEGEKWIGGQIKQKLGSRNYIVGGEAGPLIKRHIDQLKHEWSSTLDAPCSPATGTSEDEPVPQTGVGSPEVMVDRSPPPSSPVRARTPTPPPVDVPKRKRMPVKRYGFDSD